MEKKRTGLIPAVFLVLIVFVCTLWLAGRVVYRRSMERLADEGIYRVELYVSYLQGVLEKYEVLPELLATNKRLVNFLLNPGSQARIQALNQYLETINNISDAADTYLMNREGLTIAASNWQAEHPFVGRNFSYRPYFKQAMQGHLGRFFALGSTSSRRGYYFAYPVRHRAEILGAVVIKINIDSVEHNWGHINDNFLVTDPDGVIFITTNPKWRYHVLSSLAPEVRQRIIDSRRYPDASLLPLHITRTPMAGMGSIVSFVGEGQQSGKKYLLQTIGMPDAGWQVHLLSDISGVKQQVLRTRIAVGAVFLLAAMMVLLLVQRRQQLRDRHRFEQENRQMLEQANQKLESRVRERTGMLSQSNARLLLEVDERRRAEEALRCTRNELVHAAKLATLGQMSAGINHELNQPLAAIRAYTENGCRLLEKERYADVLWNLEQIAELIGRMSHIGEQLKVFARRTDGKLHSIALHGVIDGALEILRPALKKSPARVRVTITPEELEFLGNSVQLQQVLVNLIGNGIHALADRDNGLIQVKARQREGAVWITVTDNGPGIPRNLQKQIFEPFFTTRESGLGLGLTITQRIIQDMGGTIEYIRVNRGACFEIRLQQRE